MNTVTSTASGARNQEVFTFRTDHCCLCLDERSTLVVLNVHETRMVICIYDFKNTAGKSRGCYRGKFYRPHHFFTSQHRQSISAFSCPIFCSVGQVLLFPIVCWLVFRCFATYWQLVCQPCFHHIALLCFVIATKGRFTILRGVRKILYQMLN